jgi:hypothetical protein
MRRAQPGKHRVLGGWCGVLGVFATILALWDAVLWAVALKAPAVWRCPMAIIARQFGRPRGPLGRLIRHGIARGNAGLSRWAIEQITGHCRSTATPAELEPILERWWQTTAWH